MTSYEKYRARSDLYLPAMNQMAADLLIKNNLISVNFHLPSDFQDRKLGIDMTMSIDDIKLAYRTRSYNYGTFALEGFTLRTAARQGLTELQKVISGTYADYLLYAIEDEVIEGALWAGILIDMKSVAWQLITYPSILANAKRGAAFVDLNYDSFPHPVVAAFSNSLRLKEVH